MDEDMVLHDEIDSSRIINEEVDVIVTVVLHDLCLTLFFYFTKSNSSHPFIDLIFHLILSISHDIYLILPIISRSLSHFHYLSFQMRWLFYNIIQGCWNGLSTRTQEDGLPRPTRM